MYRQHCTDEHLEDACYLPALWLRPAVREGTGCVDALHVNSLPICRCCKAQAELINPLDHGKPVLSMPLVLSAITAQSTSTVSHHRTIQSADKELQKYNLRTHYHKAFKPKRCALNFTSFSPSSTGSCLQSSDKLCAPRPPSSILLCSGLGGPPGIARETAVSWLHDVEHTRAGGCSIWCYILTITSTVLRHGHPDQGKATGRTSPWKDE